MPIQPLTIEYIHGCTDIDPVIIAGLAADAACIANANRGRILVGTLAAMSGQDIETCKRFLFVVMLSFRGGLQTRFRPYHTPCDTPLLPAQPRTQECEDFRGACPGCGGTVTVNEPNQITIEVQFWLPLGRSLGVVEQHVVPRG